MYDIPILVIIFKRVDVSLQCIKAISSVKPSKIYISGDGSRPMIKGETEQVEQTRKAVIEAIDWPCEVITRFNDCNLGCSQGVKTAIDWFFKYEDRGIIVEDDCILRKSFFPFVKELLERYADDQRIGMIDAANYNPNIRIPWSYGFSKYKSTNGWATWRRAWRLMDMDMKWRGTEWEQSIIDNMDYRSKGNRYWRYRLKAIDCKDVSAWDWQWYFILSANNMLAIYPQYSLITNIGFGEGATHTALSHVPDYYKSTKEIDFPLTHPQYVVPYTPFEKAFYHTNNTMFNRIKQLFPLKIKKIIKSKLRG